ncbi:crossover junction endodeoxyribonuclease RuvC [Thioalkalivibrio sp. HL-Eb18]|jgi:crossover junction endodeoxyribonuclease RuvC|uniref:crossover junction endodeoxyribonuclease RuvC n=1 Tax=Thioalkalivibrio sp. HL-Eb18 TaxID=1266913 RepID=UPI000377D7F6|nr:crossover junction endodeoxyribonuclease RuvC [Thioalkalivibrio sp. HL-Eb18]
MRILGIDPGSRITGFAVIEYAKGQGRSRGHGVIRPRSKGFPERLGEIFTGVVEVIGELKPDVLAIETVFVARNAQSAIKLGHARGAAICAATQAGLPVHEYAPRAIKMAVVGVGSADKEQVQHMMQQLLRLTEPASSDAADALAVALCHAHTAQHQARLAGAASAVIGGRP